MKQFESGKWIGPPNYRAYEEIGELVKLIQRSKQMEELSVPYGRNDYEQMNQAKMAVQPTLKQRLEIAVKRAEEQLKTAKEAKEIFDRNPDLERLLDLMQRGSF